MLRTRLSVSLIAGIPVTALSMIPALHFSNWKWWALALSLPVAVWGAAPFHRAAWMNARHRTTTMDTLISIGIIAAMGWSVWALVWGNAAEDHGGMNMMSSEIDHIYVEVAVAVTIFLLAGRYFEARAKRRAGDALRSLLALGARTATVLATVTKHSSMHQRCRRATSSSCDPARSSLPTAWCAREPRRSTLRCCRVKACRSM